MKRRLMFVGACVFPLLLTACGGSSGDGGGDSSETIKLGMANPFTGAAATYGEEAKQGVEMALKEINERDGKCYDDREAEVIYEDDKGTPEGGVTAVQKLMSQHQVNALVGGSNSSVVLAEASVTKDQMVFVNTAAQADQITDEGGSMLFQINNTVTQNAKAFNAYITDTLKPQSIVYMGEDTAFNSGVLDQLTSDLDAAGIQLLAAEKYQADTNDFTPILNKLKASDADAIFVADAFPARAAALLQQLNQVGAWDTVLVSPGVVTQGYIDAAGENINGIITGEIYSPTIESDANKAFVEDYGKQFDGALPGKVQLVTYEGVLAVCDAMTDADSATDQKAIAESLKDLSIDTPRGTLSFGEKGRAVAPSFFIQTVENGELVVIDEVQS